jgi:hypothetical protein
VAADMKKIQLSARDDAGRKQLSDVGLPADTISVRRWCYEMRRTRFASMLICPFERLCSKEMIALWDACGPWLSCLSLQSSTQISSRQPQV